VILKVVDIHSYYKNSYVLQGVSLAMEKATVVALLGRNGMGKTTTIRSIMGMTSPRRGRVLFRGEDITGMEPFRIGRKGMGLVPQGRRIFPSLTVKENLTIVPNYGETSHWDMDRLMELFPGLKDRIRTKARFLSGGEQQMLAIARALRGNPDLLLMDEPSEGLAPLMVQEVRRILKLLKRESGVSILIVEQNIGLALSIADYAYVMSKGRIVFESTPEELARNDEVKTCYLGV
jgi:branched-chain amino acid transport system ATP-binding protein